MKKLLIVAFVLSFVALPAVSHAGLFDFLRNGQGAQVKTSVTSNTAAYYKKGDRADVILEIQKALNARGLYAGDLSGLIGNKTEAAIRAWQSSYGLEVTGVLDARTVDSILGRDGGSVSLRGGENPPISATSCGPLAAPWIHVNSPNGGETYTPGQTITVTWSSCNVPSSTMARIEFYSQFEGGAPQNVITPNTGSVSYVMPSTASFPPLEYGNYYKIYIDHPSLTIQGDMSDNFFSIVEDDDGGSNCLEANALSSYTRTINAGLGEQVVAKYAIENNCPNEVSIDKMTFSLVAFKGQDLIVQADLFENVAGILTPVSGTHNFTHTVTPSGQENTRMFVLSTDNNGVSIVTLPPGDSTIIEMHAKTQSQIPSVYENPTAFVVGLSDLDYYDLVLEQSGDWTQTSPVWGERTIINAL